jgi:hypothetical protein
MSFVTKRGWPARAGLAAAFALSALPHAFAQDRAPTKPVIVGFIDMQTIIWHNADGGKPAFTLDNIKKFSGMFGGIVLNATWAEMQRTPDPNRPLTTARLDRALNQVRRYNAAHPAAPLGVKLRIFSGNQAPAWAKAINGGPLNIERNPQGCPTWPSQPCPITIGKVWDPQYVAAWRAFQRRVAALYDSEPLIRSVAITSCTMQTDEPFVMPVKQKAPPGYTNAKGKTCLRGAVDDYAAWHRTPIDFTFNAFLPINPRGQSDPQFSISVMNACRAKLGKRCELGNHALAANMVNPNLGIVQAIAARGAPIHYQTVGPKLIASWPATVEAARRYKATALELWPNGFTTLTQAQMRHLFVVFHRQD